MEASAMLPALKRVADPTKDARGSARRRSEERKRATGAKGQPSRDEAYNF